MAGLEAALFFVAMAIHLTPLSSTIPKLQLSFSKAAFRAILARWGSESLHRLVSWH